MQAGLPVSWAQSITYEIWYIFRSSWTFFYIDFSTLLFICIVKKSNESLRESNSIWMLCGWRPFFCNAHFWYSGITFQHWMDQFHSRKLWFQLILSGFALPSRGLISSLRNLQQQLAKQFILLEEGRSDPFVPLLDRWNLLLRDKVQTNGAYQTRLSLKLGSSCWVR